MQFTPAAQAQAPAFPGALGYGSVATGGRNGTVFHVTNTNDSGSGSFRDAVNGSNRTIVFDVGGTIKLLTAVSCKGDLTILGQTAPGGIKFDGGEISFANRNNIICRFIRVRPGSDTSSTGDDCISLYRARTAIFDHVSMEFGPWNNLDAVSDDWQNWPVTDITFQHCICANPTYDAANPPPQGFGAHTESVASDWTWCYSIFANSHNRNPLAKVNDVFINNIEYNCSAGYTTHTSTKFKHDIVNNYFVHGPASGGNFPWYQIDNNQSIYAAGNYSDANKNGTLDGSISPIYWYQGGGTVLISPWSSWTSIIPTMSSALAWRYGLSTAGDFPHDEVDALLISQMKTLGSGTTGTGAGTTGPSGGLYSSQSQTGLGNNGYGVLNGLAAIPDTDNDGMADYWEQATGSSYTSANPLTNTVNGYTLLENYANFLAAPHAVTRSNAQVTVNLRQFAGGFGAGATFSLSNAVNGSVSLVNGTNAVFTPTANFTGLGSFNFTITDGSYSLGAVVTVCVTPNTPPTSATAFSGALVGASAAATTVPLPANLLWRGDGTANAWNTTASNWLEVASPAKFKNNDAVTFDDTGSNTPAITLSGTLAPSAMVFDHTKNYTLSGSGSLTGTGSFSKSGSGTLTMGTANSGMTGTIDLAGGVLSLLTGTSLGSGAITIQNNTTLVLDTGGADPVNPIVIPDREGATLTSTGLGNEFKGPITGGSASAINIQSGVSFGQGPEQFSGFSGTVMIPSGQTLRLSNVTGSNGGNNTTFNVNGTLEMRNESTTGLIGALTGSGILTVEKVQTGAGTATFSVGARNLDTTFAGTIVDLNGPNTNTALTKVGSGKLTLTGVSPHAGPTTVSAGTLLVNGTFLNSRVTVASGGTLAGTGTLNGGVGLLTGGSISPGLGVGGVGTMTIGGGFGPTNATLYFDLSSSPAGSNDKILMTGGKLAMNGSQTYMFHLLEGKLGDGNYELISGATDSSAWGSASHNLPGTTRQTFSLVRPAAGSNPSYTRLTVSGNPTSLVWDGTGGGTWDLNATANWLSGVTPSTFYNLDLVRFDDSSANGSVTLSGTLYPGSITVSNSATSYAFSGGVLAGSGPLTKSGSGTLTINPANSTYTGNITVNGGTLAAASGSDLGSGTITLNNGSTCFLDYGSSVVFVGRDFVVPANQTGTISSDALGNEVSGNLSSGNSASVLNLYGGVSFGGTTSAQFDNFTGTINLQSGANLRFSADSSGNAYGSLAPTLIINGTLQPRNAGNTVMLGTISGSGTLAGAQSPYGTGDTLYIIGGNNADANFSGNISSNSAVADSAVALTKTGSGTLTLNGASTYTGSTTVENGTLRVNNSTGSGTGSGDLEVFSGATLAGTGIIGSSTTIDGGATLAPGDPAGALTFSNGLTLNASSILEFTLGTSSDRVNVNGGLLLAGQLHITNAPGFAAGSYTLFTSSGGINFDDLTLVSAPASYNYSFNTNTPGQLKLVVSLPVPPSFVTTVLSGSNLVFSGSNGTPLGDYFVLTSTNLLLPATNWTRVATNQFDANGAFSFTNTIEPGTPQDFYRLQQ